MSSKFDDLHDYGTPGAPAGMPDFHDDGIDHIGAVLTALRAPRPVDPAPLHEARQQLAQGQVRRAMEKLSGAERCAIATTPVECRLHPLSDRDLDDMAQRDGDAGEARLHFFGRRPVNPHE